MALVRSDGRLLLDDHGVELYPGMTSGEFAAGAAGKASLQQFGAGVQFALGETRVAGEVMDATVIFEGTVLSRVDLCKRLPHDAKGWDGWTKEGEMERKRLHEAWAERTFGAPMAVKPLRVEYDNGAFKDVTPFEVKWDTLRHALFAWGEVISFMDSKGGFAGLTVRYGPP